MKKIYIILISSLLLLMPNFINADYIPYEPWIWKQNPSICINFDNQTSHYKWGIIRAIDEWKTKLNNFTASGKFTYNLFQNDTRFNHTGDCNVVFYLDANLKNFPYIPEDAYGYTDCDGHICKVYVFDTTPSNYLVQTVKHEMGHVLGLGHRMPFTRCDLISVVTSNDIMIFQAGPFRWITNDDIKALLNEYGLGFNQTHPFNTQNKYVIFPPPQCV